MSSTKKITCVITGKQTVYSGDFLLKKIEEYGSEEILNEQYICKEVKGFLKKGYKIADIRKILKINDSCAYPSDEIVSILEKNYIKTSILKETPTFNETLTGFTYNKSDDLVEKFINQYII